MAVEPLLPPRPDPWGATGRVTPYVGMWALYTLNDSDAASINHQRIEDGCQANHAKAGDVYPMLVVRIFDTPSEKSVVNAQVFVDGNFVFWATSRHQGTPVQEGRWYAPPKR